MNGIILLGCRTER